MDTQNLTPYSSYIKVGDRYFIPAGMKSLNSKRPAIPNYDPKGLQVSGIFHTYDPKESQSFFLFDF